MTEEVTSVDVATLSYSDADGALSFTAAGTTGSVLFYAAGRIPFRVQFRCCFFELQRGCFDDE